MPSKKKLKKQIVALTNAIEIKDLGADEVRRSLVKRTSERDYWRNQYERQVLTPEAKVDTEAAFKRGEESATQKMKAWFLKTAQELNEVVQDSNEE